MIDRRLENSSGERTRFPAGDPDDNRNTKNPMIRRLRPFRVPTFFLLFAMTLAPSITSADPAPPRTALHAGKPAKYVFLFIGDGMGLAQKAAAEAVSGRRLTLDAFPAHGVTGTRAANRFITDSAAAATALSTGRKTNIGRVGVTPGGERLVTLAELTKETGRKVGIVTSVSLDHATPAAFYAHVPDRTRYHAIAHALAASGFDYFAGGGFKDPMGERAAGSASRGDAWEAVRTKGYAIVSDRAGFAALKPGDGKVLARNARLPDGHALPYAMDRRPEDIALAEFVAKGIEMLDNPRGFFMMVEGGKIDWACHANDIAAAVHEVLAFDAAVRRAVEFFERHDDETLIVVTGDHECGGLALGSATAGYAPRFALLRRQKMSVRRFTDEILRGFSGDFAAVKTVVSDCFGLRFEGDSKTDPLVLEPFQAAILRDAFERRKPDAEEAAHVSGSEDRPLYDGIAPLAAGASRILGRKAGFGWTTDGHTGLPVLTAARGVGAGTFNGRYENTGIAFKVMAAMGIPSRVRIAGSDGADRDAGTPEQRWE